NRARRASLSESLSVSRSTSSTGRNRTSLCAPTWPSRAPKPRPRRRPTRRSAPRNFGPGCCWHHYCYFHSNGGSTTGPAASACLASVGWKGRRDKGQRDKITPFGRVILSGAKDHYGVRRVPL